MKLNIYYHIWAPSNDPLIRFLIDEQMKRLELHSLINQATLNVCIVGKCAKEIEAYVQQYNGVNIRLVTVEEKGWELHTLDILYKDCVDNPKQYVMYMHTKGLSHFYNADKNPKWVSNINTWRHFMEYVCIDSWRECVKDLAEFDTVGMNLYRAPFVHYSGNFWWARGSHIVNLKNPFVGSDTKPTEGQKDTLTERHNAESWVCSVNGRHKTRLQVAGSLYSTSKFGQYKTMKNS